VQSAGDWNSFFGLLPPDMRRELKALFDLPANGDMDQVISALPEGAPPDLVDLRIVATALANPDSELVETEFDAAGTDLPDLPGKEAKAVWLFQHQRHRYDEMAQLLEHERHFQKDNSWNGYEIDAQFVTSNISEKNDLLKSDLAAALGTRANISRDIHLSTFRHASSRSCEPALHLTIAFGRGRETVRTIDAGRRSRKSFRRERVVSVVLDAKTRAIDIVGKDESKSLRKRVLLVLMKHMSITTAGFEDVPARWVMVDRLGSRNRFELLPTDLPIKVRLLSVTLVRGSSGVVHFDARHADAEDAWMAWARWAGTDGENFGTSIVIRATLEFTFPPADGSRPTKVRMLKMSGPHSLVVRHWSPEQVEAATDLLARWGLLSWTMVDARSAA